LAVLGVFVCVVALLLFKSATMRTQIKRGLIFLLIIAGILVGYFFLTGKSPAEIPARIDQFFNTPRAPEDGTHRYYNDPEERYKDQL